MQRCRDCPSKLWAVLWKTERQWRANPDWDINCDFTTFRDSIWTINIWFKKSQYGLRLGLIFLRFDWKRLKSRQASCLLTDTNWNVRIIETLTHSMQFDAETAPYYLTDWHCMCIVTLQTISCVIRPKIYHVKYHNLDFLFKIYLHTRFCEGFEI